MKTLGFTFTHLFSSHLQRAAKTAGKIREAQLASPSGVSNAQPVPEVAQLPVLMEQDFGSMEGSKWNLRPVEMKVPGKDAVQFVDVESKDAMGKRANAFLDDHLLHILDDPSAPVDLVIAIVSHGIFLSTLWTRLLRRLPPKSVTLCLDAQATRHPSLEHLGGWSNTGYLELHMSKTSVDEPVTSAEVPSDVSRLAPALSARLPAPQEEVKVDQAGTAQILPQVVSTVGPSALEGHSTSVPDPRFPQGWSTKILTINGKDHLKGLKRTGGGVGSSRHDTSQKSIETFFKRRKVG